MIYYGEGSLKLSKKMFAFDGVNYFKIFSPALFFKILHSKKRDLGILGRWLAINNIIIWAHK